MSRTFKDRPHFVRAEWWEPKHWQCRYRVPWHRQKPIPVDHDCDLPPEPIVSSYERTANWRCRTPPRCRWEPVWDRRMWYQASPPRDYVHVEFHGPQRRKARDFGSKAIAEYRASGDVETVEPERRARNSCKWLFW